MEHNNVNFKNEKYVAKIGKRLHNKRLQIKGLN